MDIVVWLRSLGLGKYEATFRKNEIDEAVLPGLTHEHPEGAWLELLDAIAALRAEGGTKVLSPADVPVEQSATPPSAASVAQAAGERRYLTMMFCDLVDSTNISVDLR
jgi:SAM domain (Sterile alpha motif)